MFLEEVKTHSGSGCGGSTYILKEEIQDGIFSSEPSCKIKE